MGFRSTFITEDYNFKLPSWFIEKYDKILNFGGNKDDGFSLPISTKFEIKQYVAGADIVTDLQKVMNEGESDLDDFRLVWLHECGGITLVEISKDKIMYIEPEGSWKKVEGVTHDYCYGCSDVDEK